MLPQLMAAIKPAIRIDRVIQQWNQICHHLSESHPRRKLQLRPLT